jgi:hypothetical protein
MKLFTSGIDKKLFAQYAKGSDLKNQKVIAKIFNPYGKGLWFIINSDPNDPDYLWAIVSLDEVEVGSVSRKELENLRVGKFRLPLERDLYFTPMNAEEVLEGVREGKRFARGGELDSVDIDSLKKGDKIKITYSSGISNSKEVELEVRSKNLVNKGKSNEKEKVTFINVANPQGVKYYAYKSMKDGYVGFAIGDMAIWGVKEVSKMAKGGNVYSSDDAYLVEIYKDGEMVDEQIVRARNKGEAREMFEDYHLTKMTKKHGEDITYEIEVAPSKMAKGGNVSEKNYVAVSEKDGYWYIITRPTTKEKAQEMIDLGIPRGEIGKVVTLEEAKEHKKVIGKEYLAQGGYMAKGGMIKYNGKMAKIISKKKDFQGNLMYFVEIENYHPNGDTLRTVLREDDFDKMAKGGYMAQGGWLEHGIFQGDKILKTDGSFLIIEDKNGEIQVVNIEKGVRVNPMLDDSKMSGKRTMAEGDAMEAAENYIEFSKSSMFAKGGETESSYYVWVRKGVSDDEEVYKENLSKSQAKNLMNQLWDEDKYFEVGMKTHKYGEGGHIGFDKLSQKVAKNYEGKAVKREYQVEYGKRYDADEAREVGDKVAAKVYRLQLAKK